MTNVAGLAARDRRKFPFAVVCSYRSAEWAGGGGDCLFVWQDKKLRGPKIYKDLR